jgi:AcrR family transcriptional regulator
MNQSEKSDVAERRKEQVLDGAAECFRLYGFHQSSMAKISASAGMSTGHIYHYFKSKEEIIIAIAEREQGIIQSLFIDKLHDCSTPDEAKNIIISQSAKGAEIQKDVARAALLLEVLVEAARNEDINKVIHDLDSKVRKAVYAALGGDEPVNRSKMELIGAFMEGLSIRMLRNPKAGEDLDEKMLEEVIRFIFSMNL